MHVLGLPPAFVLSQDQTLKFERRTIHQIRKPDERPAHVIVHLQIPAEASNRKMHIVLFHPDQSSIQPKDQTDNQTVEQHKDAKQTVTHDQPSQTETRQNRQPHIPFNPTMSNSRANYRGSRRIPWPRGFWKVRMPRHPVPRRGVLPCSGGGL